MQLDAFNYLHLVCVAPKTQAFKKDMDDNWKVKYFQVYY